MYLDPSFGGMLIQIIIAIAVAGGALAFGMRKKIASFFVYLKHRKHPVAEIAVQPVPTPVDPAGGAIDVLDDADTPDGESMV